ncbi:precorrin-6y C5,15-methyltransferase (decarboxylating) subunit CbiE [Limibaculum sp. M0105]|uniref:Precorrin-6y C5,15-methyltransferase (Decarboxylating) subunit CbiE n=1 Tax=Thermohalobaculum xanthum TaxID=2753746 RepID=A0A8J7M3U2_9RHOB|nr:precorrin-6y C5,15-methyltransferase (decarboxylating) subunit CbiE [Thermohalobaculum xanthum]MBK0397826.1 precorrin-6y C5,15-methyltransferase (decarboxylating) subunit CbiE [Thermohalobaculum xanthum]
MTAPWLTIAGIGEDGMAGLSAAARRAVEQAEIIIGGERHHALAPGLTAERVAWPSPFDALVDLIRANRGRRVVILATGDPLWFSVGARIASAIPREEIVFHPQLSAFQWASCRMGWSLADVETLTAHGRPAAQVIPAFWPGVRLLILTSGPETPGEIARLLVARGYGDSAMTVLGNLGGEAESRMEGTARDWAASNPAVNVPPLHTLAVECRGTPDLLLGRVPGLPDEAFTHDGKITKREVRAVTLSRLMPSRGALLWDIGTGCGSVAIEWMRAAPDATAVGFDLRPERLEMARRNAEELGTPRLALIEGAAPGVLASLPAPVGTKPDLRRPDAVFIGGGLARETVAAAWSALKPSGRLVANAVTLESEALLIALQSELGGELTRLSVARAGPVGGLTGWRPMMPVTQWSLLK